MKGLESDAPTQTTMAMRAPLAMVLDVDDDDDEPEEVGLPSASPIMEANRINRPAE
jgi:hypothetical protein